MNNTLFLPLVLSQTVIFYGLAMAYGPDSDASLLKAQWRYNWSPGDAFPRAAGEWIPMLWHGIPHSSVSREHSDWLLAMNEPDNPHQLNISPEEASRRLASLKEHYPNAKIVAPGILSYNHIWMTEFVKLGVFPDVWSYHAYIEGPYNSYSIIDQLSRMHDITGGTVWITEFGVLSGNQSEFSRILRWFEDQKWIERIAVYTNRQPHTDQSWELSSNVELVEDTGILKPCGTTYVERRRRK